MKDSLLDSADMDFTPSEIDALEAIPPPDYLSPKIPATSPAPRLPRPPFNLFGSKEMGPEDRRDALQETEEQILEPQQNSSGAPPQKQMASVNDSPTTKRGILFRVRIYTNLHLSRLLDEAPELQVRSALPSHCPLDQPQIRSIRVLYCLDKTINSMIK